MRDKTLSAYDKLVERLVKCLDSSGLDYAFTGALAVSFYGSPRTTSDVDLMVAFGDSPDVKQKVVDSLQCACIEIQERKIDEALLSGYNIASFKDKTSPFRVDVIFSSKKLDKQPAKIAGLNTFLQKPEGLVVAKLRMIKATLPKERATKDKQDIKSILAFSNVDLEAVKQQAKKDQTLDILENLINQDY
jgi:hypothetical protein